MIWSLGSFILGMLAQLLITVCVFIGIKLWAHHQVNHMDPDTKELFNNIWSAYSNVNDNYEKKGEQK